MEFQNIEKIIKEEINSAMVKILERLKESDDTLDITDTRQMSISMTESKPLPDNEKYSKALNLYRNGETHSGVARELGVSVNAVKKYYNWLVNNGYLPVEDTDLSEAEQKVVECIYSHKMSLRKTALMLGCSVTNVVYRRDSALRKGYNPNIDDSNN